MNTQILKNTIAELFANGKGILAMDESSITCDKRFEASGIPRTEEMRRQYRQLLVTTPGLNESIGGAILFDETIRQKTDTGELMAEVLMKAGILPGIKVDKGTVPLAGFPNELITEGLDGLRERLSEYKTLGARFAKWRAVIKIGDGIPTVECINANVYLLTRYAALCQEAHIVPIIEPEVLMEGDHSLQECYNITEQVLKSLFYQLYQFKINLEGIILKPNMIVAGNTCEIQNSNDEVAEATFNCLRSCVPAVVPAIAFLSGGQSPEYASANLRALNKNFKGHLPWIVTFSFARAIQQPALDVWKGEPSNIEQAQNLLYHYAKMAAEERN